jgi:GNAT superfamily N-acetyltransferase
LIDRQIKNIYIPIVISAAQAACGDTERAAIMHLIYPNIVPANNLRLPDSLTIKHGPARLLSKFVLEGDRVARRMGLQLRLRHDFDELLYFNRQRAALGDWYRLPNMFHPEYSDLASENSYWICGEDEYGEIVVTQAGRVYYWPDTTLEQEARLMFYAGQEQGQSCIVTAPDAKKISGVVFYGGSVWVRPDFRGRQLSQLVPRLGRAYALARWPVDWGISLVAPVLVEKKVAEGYGYKHVSYSVSYPGSPWGDIEFALVSLSAMEAYDDFARMLVCRFCGMGEDIPSAISSTSFREDNVTRISLDGVFQGKSSRS